MAYFSISSTKFSWCPALFGDPGPQKWRL